MNLCAFRASLVYKMRPCFFFLRKKNQTNKQTVLDEVQLAEHMPSTCKTSHLILSTKMLAGHCVDYSKTQPSGGWSGRTVISRRAWALQDSAKGRLVGGGSKGEQEGKRMEGDIPERQSEKWGGETATHRKIKHLKKQTWQILLTLDPQDYLLVTNRKCVNTCEHLKCTWSTSREQHLCVLNYCSVQMALFCSTINRNQQ